MSKGVREKRMGVNAIRPNSEFVQPQPLNCFNEQLNRRRLYCDWSRTASCGVVDASVAAGCGLTSHYVIIKATPA